MEDERYVDAKTDRSAGSGRRHRRVPVGRHAAGEAAPGARAERVVVLRLGRRRDETAGVRCRVCVIVAGSVRAVGGRAGHLLLEHRAQLAVLRD